MGREFHVRFREGLGVQFPRATRLIFRDRDSTGNGVLNERLYGMQDPNWSLTTLADTTGVVQERYAYGAYGMPNVLTPIFTSRLESSWDWDTRYAGYRYDGESGLYQVRNRYYLTILGCWGSRDLLPYDAGGYNVYSYVESSPAQFVDPFGLKKIKVQMDAFINRRLGRWLPEPIPFSDWMFATDARDFGGDFTKSRIRSWFEIGNRSVGRKK